MAGDWQTNALAAGALVTVSAAVWRWVLWPVGHAVWAAIVAAPQIANDLRDLPDLITELRALIEDNIPAEIIALKAEAAGLKLEITQLKADVANLVRTATETHTLSGAADRDDDEIPMTLHDLEAIRRRIHDAGHIPEGPA